MGNLAALPLGDRFVEAFGDMKAPGGLTLRVAGVELVSPIGLGAGLDVDCRAARAFARFGFGFLEIGPVTRDRVAGARIARRDRGIAIEYDEPLENAGVTVVAARARLARNGPAKIGFRLACARGSDTSSARVEIAESLERLVDLAAFFTLDVRPALNATWSQDRCTSFVRDVCDDARSRCDGRPFFLCVSIDSEETLFNELAAEAIAAGAAGIAICAGTARGEKGPLVVGRPTREVSLSALRRYRARLGPECVIIASGGIAEPADALAALEAGATLVQVHSGLVFSGPGLPKRINEALVARQRVASPKNARPSVRSAWATAYSGMLAGIAIAVLLVAIVRVVLPYDEAFLGMTRARIDALDSNLVPFMIHDRVTAGGTTLALAILYLGLAWFGIRSGEGWAWRATLVSSVIGFASYWLWLRLGYFEPLHALAVVAMLPLFIATVLSKMTSDPPRVIDRNDRAWYASLVGQLLFVVTGVGFVIGGLTISIVGISSIFVATDLVYLHTSAHALDLANRHLAPLIAHDRAGFGGALAAHGIALTLVALWGFRRGVAWLWWTLLLSGIPGFAGTLAVHWAIGYTTFWHLAPVYFALALYTIALVATYPYLCKKSLVDFFRDSPLSELSEKEWALILDRPRDHGRSIDFD